MAKAICPLSHRPFLPNFEFKNGTSRWSCSTDWAHDPGELGSGKLWKASSATQRELPSPWHAKCRVLPACPLWTCAEALGLWASRSFFLHAVVVACLWVVHSLKAHLQPESTGVSPEPIALSQQHGPLLLRILGTHLSLRPLKCIIFATPSCQRSLRSQLISSI